MRGLQRTVVLLAVAMASAGLPAVSQAGWITLATGPLGSVQPTDTTEFQYGSTSTPPLVAIGAVSGTGTVEAVTSGGTAFFGSLGVPVLLNLSDGSAYLIGGSPPRGAVGGSLGAGAGALSSGTPQTGVPVPPDYTQLGIALAASSTGEQLLTVSVLGTAAGSGSVVVPEGGWWVLGLSTSQEPAPEPLPEPAPTPEPIPEPVPTPQPTPGVPEPAAMALVASGTFVVVPWLRRRRRIER